MRELEDYAWFPQSFRQHQMDFLSLLARKFSLYLPVRPVLMELLAGHQPAGWTDACSGSAGPVISLAGQQEVLLTDLYPSFAHLSLPGNIRFHPQPQDITQDLPPGKGLVTLFNCFHHFNETQQEKILGMCAGAGRPVMVVELLDPSLRALVSVMAATTLGHWVLVPFMRPFSVKRLFFTYLLPLHTLTVLYDGMVSVFRSKGSKYYQSLAGKLSRDGYRLVFQKIKGPFGPLWVLTGCNG